ncbi:hypothetical protein [Rubinisphaera italica]|uniref:Uncharacterized protein n=1 Tax=Rubinisphaera italica TaxID=2527969 RepID=A0A5C5XDI9_9PLAN|nr:hypothetical protein [Rubinisphaera italica]TWT60844.1 hypothetical protein Pan54_15710 [Rubinisphaera italica]
MSQNYFKFSLKFLGPQRLGTSRKHTDGVFKVVSSEFYLSTNTNPSTTRFPARKQVGENQLDTPVIDKILLLILESKLENRHIAKSSRVVSNLRASLRNSSDWMKDIFGGHENLVQYFNDLRNYLFGGNKEQLLFNTEIILLDEKDGELLYTDAHAVLLDEYEDQITIPPQVRKKLLKIVRLKLQLHDLENDSKMLAAGKIALLLKYNEMAESLSKEFLGKHGLLKKLKETISVEQTYSTRDKKDRDLAKIIAGQLKKYLDDVETFQEDYCTEDLIPNFSDVVKQIRRTYELSAEWMQFDQSESHSTILERHKTITEIDEVIENFLEKFSSQIHECRLTASILLK